MSPECPRCATELELEPDAILGDLDCPRCGSRLWFLSFGNYTRIHDMVSRGDMYDSLVHWFANQLGVQPDQIRNQQNVLRGADSLDTVELVMELDEEFGMF